MNTMDDKLYDRTQKFISNMGNLLQRLKGEASKMARKQIEPKTQTSDIIGALIIGITVGAAASLLLAPRSGKETRERIATNFKDVSKKVAAWEKEETEKLAEMVKGGKQKVKETTT